MIGRAGNGLDRPIVAEALEGLRPLSLAPFLMSANQTSGVVANESTGARLEVKECGLNSVEPGRLIFCRIRFSENSSGEAQYGHEDMDLDSLASNNHGLLAEIDLHVVAG